MPGLPPPGLAQPAAISESSAADPPRPAWAEVKPLFEAALALPQAQRDEFVASSLASDTIRAEVRSLLAHEQHAGETWLAAEHATSGLDSTQREALPGQRFGAWRVSRLLGQGGVGEVYEAERDDEQFEGRAAIKLLKRGMDSQSVLPQDVDCRDQRAVMRLQQARLWSLMGRHGLARGLLEQGRQQTRDAFATDAGNTAGQRALQAIDLLSAALHLLAGDAAVARKELASVLQNFPADDRRRFASIRIRAKALVLDARAARAVALAAGAARRPLLEGALASARAAARLLQPKRAALDELAPQPAPLFSPLLSQARNLAAPVPAR